MSRKEGVIHLLKVSFRENSIWKFINNNSNLANFGLVRFRLGLEINNKQKVIRLAKVTQKYRR